MKYNKVQDSGKRQSFNTGSVRDTAEGKGMPHLIAGEALNNVYELYHDLLSEIQFCLFKYTEIVPNKSDNFWWLKRAVGKIIIYLQDQEGNSYAGAMRRLAQHYENGGRKYSKNNWRKGQPVSRYYDSTMRHLWKEMDKSKDEDHAAAIFWNLLGIVQTKIDVNKGLLSQELDDFPFTIVEVFGEKDKTMYPPIVKDNNE